MTRESGLLHLLIVRVRKTCREVVCILAVGTFLVLLFLAISPGELGVAQQAASSSTHALYRWLDKNDVALDIGSPRTVASLAESLPDAQSAELLRAVKDWHYTADDYLLLRRADGSVAVIVKGSFLGGRPTWVFTRTETGSIHKRTIYWHQTLDLEAT